MDTRGARVPPSIPQLPGDRSPPAPNTWSQCTSWRQYNLVPSLRTWVGETVGQNAMSSHSGASTTYAHSFLVSLSF